MRPESSRLITFGVALFICVVLIVLSVSGVLGPVQNLIAVPLAFVQHLVSGLSNEIDTLATQLGNLQNLQAENEALQRALVSYQAEIVQLREIKADYDRIAALLNYKDRTGIAARQYVPAAVIGRDTTGLLRSITIDHGQRDGLAVGMPVVTELGLVGRISAVTSVSAQVLLITDTTSYVNTRLQKPNPDGSIVEGTVQGTAGGDLRMTFIKLTDTITADDLVVTSGIGGNFPRGLTIGQVTGSRQDDSKLFLEAEVRSLIDFNRLDTVLVITNFEPFDLSAFATPTPGP
ncbi:MAG: rod shape-determining protein MreC [Aggregatilineales bacterium]